MLAELTDPASDPLSMSVPYSTRPIMHIRNSISLQVRVPVLSLKTYRTWPSSSFKETVLNVQP